MFFNVSKKIFIIGLPVTAFAFGIWVVCLFSSSPFSPLSAIVVSHRLSQGVPTRGGCGQGERRKGSWARVSPSVTYVQGTHEALNTCWLSPSFLSVCQSLCGLLAPPDYSVYSPTLAFAASLIS